MSHKDSRKQELLEGIHDRVFESTGRDEVAAEFARRMLRRIPLDELEEIGADNLAVMAGEYLEFARRRVPGDINLRVYNPDPEQHGWHSSRTIIEIVNDDMPFLVDSVVLALSELGISVRLVIHPVMRIERDPGGHLMRLVPEGDESTGQQESLMHLQVEHQRFPEILARIEERVRLALADVRRAVNDWQPMLAQAREIAEELERTHPQMSEGALEETRDFFEWLASDHFTFLGYREYVIEDGQDGRVLRAIPESGLGIMHTSHREAPVRSLKDLSHGSESTSPDDPIIITKTNASSTVHRAGYMDYISVLYFDDDGNVSGEKRLIGLFTSGAYIRRCQDTPLVRRKVQKVLKLSGLQANSHAGKALLHILETLPRDELFQASSEELLELGSGVLDLQERAQTRLFIRRERFGRFFSCMVFIPRDRFNTENREKIQQIIKRSLKGERLDFAVQVGESKLARVQLIVRPRSGESVDFDIDDIERKIKQAIRSWSDELTDCLVREHGEDQGVELARRYARAFPASYMEDISPHVASFDVANIARLRDLDDLRMSLYRPRKRHTGILRFKLFRHGSPLPLSDVLPMLENLGMRIVSERPYELRMGSGHSVWIQDFDMKPPGEAEVDLDRVRDKFQEAFEQTWRRRCENDGFNRLVMLARIDWRQVNVLRACCKYLLQTGMPFSQTYMEQTLSAWPLIARLLVEYFEARFDPARAEESKQQKAAARRDLEQQCQVLAEGIEDEVLREFLGEVCQARESDGDETEGEVLRKAILRALNAVSSADQDRILRGFCDLVRAMLRTNAYQSNRRGGHAEYLSFKLDSGRVPDLPQPRPYREIWVYSPRMEGIHLRGGKVARGGLRWSDRREDFRTEVLGLLRAQNVKNTMIVPVGAKGGFVAKQLPEGEDRDAMMAEVVHCYRSFINGMLDITDNLDGERVLPPSQVVRKDDDDPYLVVAADKGTATFSDIANAVSAEHDFWLGDAFASGGSNGYDHKKMGITARGAWESVKRHFRELGLNTQEEDFSVVGIGDMGGDVFGNGMLLSRHIRLKAAFNHMHIFLDPDPDPEASFAERRRLFEKDRSTWADYDEQLISKGGGVFSRQAKSIELSDEVREWLGLEAESLAPHELIRELLKAPVDLLWNGGIGTYVKGEHEAHADVGDLANNLVRVNGNDLQCRVVGEGGNLGLTQLGRIEYAMNGGRINTDFIDNSAGVDCSDHEVNIKILLNLAVERGQLDLTERNRLLESMTEEVSGLVLRSNYLQNQALSMMEALTRDRLGAEAHFVAMLERQGVLDRDLEQLPDEEELRERVARGQGLTRPELSLLLSYAKIRLYEELLDSDVPEDPYLSRELKDYFPGPLRERFAELMPEHRLWREIIATRVTNSIVNRMSAPFAMRIKEDTGASSATVAKAYTVAREIFEARVFWKQIESLDNQVPAARQVEALQEMWNLLRQVTRRLITLPGGYGIDISSRVERFAPGIREYRKVLPKLLMGDLRESLEERCEELVTDGFPRELALEVATLRYVYSALDIVDEARLQEMKVEDVSRIYFLLFDRLCLKWLRGQVESLPVERQWHAHARGHLRDDLYRHHRELTRRILNETGDQEEPVEAWFQRHENESERVSIMLEEMRNTSSSHDFAVLQVAINALGQLMHSTSD
ncbi:NAD-glutamate dehydrogenase [Wenzhouxiangella sp. AB-CW3]|uniref:NAD-glutamate dehydrogenase n=1 Tax=Wenzhouxiangella sp. AB-CW3 TaxID=2771012 RepID=UPI00168A436A|nr:NAD-glutamate dehydrogenase [Wenzhouxiangella sp. AB-CW3]QOC23814.1 NAD-glutamate dehydrogenase [Wenzhouxiangella sp. AB-CW3]